MITFKCVPENKDGQIVIKKKLEFIQAYRVSMKISHSATLIDVLAWFFFTFSLTVKQGILRLNYKVHKKFNITKYKKSSLVTKRWNFKTQLNSSMPVASVAILRPRPRSRTMLLMLLTVTVSIP